VDVVIDHALFATVAVPRLFDPSYNVIVSPVTPVPVIVGVVTEVGLAKALIVGAEGAVISTIKAELVTGVAAVPAEFDTFAVMV